MVVEITMHYITVPFNPSPLVQPYQQLACLKMQMRTQVLLTAVSGISVSWGQSLKFRGHITHCTDADEDEEGGGGEVVTYELEFDLKKYLQRYVPHYIQNSFLQ